MDFNKAANNGGADGCIDFEDPDNAGLKGCMLEAVHEFDSSNVSLELMWQDFCTRVSAADFFVIAAEALMEATTPSSHQSRWGDNFANGFKFGRRTQLTCSPEELPNPIHACDATQDVFLNRMGLDWTQATALMGVHTLGRALPQNSGYDGFWVSQEHARIFSNVYFQRILNVGWSRENLKKDDGSAGKWQWKRADNGAPGEMMLNTDMCLGYGSGDAPHTRAEDNRSRSCCLWMDRGHPSMKDTPCECQGNAISEGCTHSNCCKAARGGCGHDPFRRSVRTTQLSRTLDAVTKYSARNTGMDAWNADFMRAWRRTTEQGHEADLC